MINVIILAPILPLTLTSSAAVQSSINHHHQQVEHHHQQLQHQVPQKTSSNVATKTPVTISLSPTTTHLVTAEVIQQQNIVSSLRHPYHQDELEEPVVPSHRDSSISPEVIDLPLSQQIVVVGGLVPPPQQQQQQQHEELKARKNDEDVVLQSSGFEISVDVKPQIHLLHHHQQAVEVEKENQANVLSTQTSPLHHHHYHSHATTTNVSPPRSFLILNRWRQSQENIESLSALPSPPLSSSLKQQEHENVFQSSGVSLKTTSLRNSLPIFQYNPLTSTLRTTSITTANSLTRLSYPDNDANEILMPLSHVLDTNVQVQVNNDPSSPPLVAVRLPTQPSVTPPPISAISLDSDLINNENNSSHFPTFNSNINFQHHHHQQHRHSTSFLPTKTSSYSFMAIPTSSQATTTNTFVNTATSSSTSTTNLTQLTTNNIASNLGGTTSGSIGTGINERLGSLFSGRFASLFHHHHHHHHAHHQKHLHQQPATQHRSTIDFNEFITKNNFYNKQNEMAKPKSHQDFLSLSLSPPLNRRNKDMPALRGPFVSL